MLNASYTIEFRYANQVNFNWLLNFYKNLKFIVCVLIYPKRIQSLNCPYKGIMMVRKVYIDEYVYKTEYVNVIATHEYGKSFCNKNPFLLQQRKSTMHIHRYVCAIFSKIKEEVQCSAAHNAHVAQIPTIHSYSIVCLL